MNDQELSEQITREEAAVLETKRQAEETERSINEMIRSSEQLVQENGRQLEAANVRVKEANIGLEDVKYLFKNVQGKISETKNKIDNTHKDIRYCDNRFIAHQKSYNKFKAEYDNLLNERYSGSKNPNLASIRACKEAMDYQQEMMTQYEMLKNKLINDLPGLNQELSAYQEVLKGVEANMKDAENALKQATEEQKFAEEAKRTAENQLETQKAYGEEQRKEKQDAHDRAVNNAAILKAALTTARDSLFNYAHPQTD